MLVGQLLAAGHFVRVVDWLLFGNYLQPHESLEILRRDIRTVEESAVSNFDVVVHLANVANDPAVELDPGLSWEINVLATERLLRMCSRGSVKHFIYASSGSVYGIKDEVQVTEELDPVPFSTYNKTKLIAERVALSFASAKMSVHCIRPATVCGVSPRMRFDVSVNMFCMQAFRDRRVRVMGGDQVRPNIHINDLARVIRHFIDSPGLPSGAYNAGFENMRILDMALFIANLMGVEVEVVASNDPRSYRQDSSLLLSTGFVPQKTVADAANEVCSALVAGEVTDRQEWYTIQTMKRQLPKITAV